MKSALFLLLLCLTPTTFGNEDYYELLGVNKDADNREIRKAFKKLAVSMHPDKNQARPYIFLNELNFLVVKLLDKIVYICLFLFYNCAAHEQTLTMIILQDDKDAHDKFVKIARAYETLKDPDLRKHYDVYGDDDNQNKHQGYQSWSYYRDNFGIYDDDPEIITLTRAEFGKHIFKKCPFTTIISF